MWTYTKTDELYHYGVKGMKWGVRRYMRAAKNIDRDAESLRKAGYKKEAEAVQKVANKYREKAKKSQEKYAQRKSDLKNRRKMSNEVLEKKIKRLKMEQEYKRLAEKDLKPGRTAVKKFMQTTGGKVLTSASVGALAYTGKVVLSKGFNMKDFKFKDLNFQEAASYVFPNPNKKK